MILCRPESFIAPSMLDMYERRGWWAQCKMQGAYSQVTVVDGEVTDVRSRRDKPHRAWSPNEQFARVYRCLPKGRFVFVAELLHSKVPGIRNVHYIHDVVEAGGEWTVGKSYEQRWEVLSALFGREVSDEQPTHWVLDECAWLARCWRPGANYAKVFASMERPEHEGLVLKNPVAPLTTRGATGFLKCRRPTPNLSC